MDKVIIPKIKMPGLSGNMLKFIALIAMTVDHIGVQLFPNIVILRIIGRLAFPIFGYMIAEGCTYTKSRKKYLAFVGITAFLCQVVYLFAMESLYQCIFVTFSLSIILIYLFDDAVKNGNIVKCGTAILALVFVAFLTLILPNFWQIGDFDIDYGFFGIIYPVMIYYAKGHTAKLAAAAAGLVLVSVSYGYIQWYSLLALALICFYNGERGKRGFKWLFYVYYPVHLCVIYGISVVLE